MDKKLGIAILSFAHGHAATYARQIVTFPDAQLIACWDDNQERGQTQAEKFGMAYTPHLEDILENPAVDAVIVTSETNRHADLAVAAAEAGKNILCQKPMALTLADCERMKQASERAGISFAMAFQMRHDPMNIKMKELVESGAVGRISMVRRRHCIDVLFNKDFINGPAHWHLEADKNMGMFMDDAVHAADWFRWMLGNPVSVMAEIDNTVTDVAPDDTGVAIYRYPNRAFGVLTNSSVTLAAESTTEIYGDEGVIIQNYGDMPSTKTAPRDGTPPLKLYRKGEGWQTFDFPIPQSQGDRIAGVPRPWIDSLKNGTPPPANAEDGLRSVEMVLGAYRSASEGRRIHFPLEEKS